jgi:hypothetical protein
LPAGRILETAVRRLLFAVAAAQLAGAGGAGIEAALLLPISSN